VASSAWSVPVEPWIAQAGRAALPYGVYVYKADVFGLTLAAPNGAQDGVPLMRHPTYVHRFDLEEAVTDIAGLAAHEIGVLAAVAD